MRGPDKVACWEDLIGHYFARIDLNCGREGTLDRRTTVWELGPLCVTTYRADRGLGQRTKRHIANGRDECFSVLLLNSGSLHLSQRGRDSVLEDGHLCVLDTRGDRT